MIAISGNANALCPAIGNDTDCGVIITITDSSSSVTFTDQGPYDGVEDTLVGVVNNSSRAIRSIGLRSALSVFEFDGDGIVAYGAPGNGNDSTGYGGPNAYFTNINADLTSGTVNFIAPLAANGGTGYFSLEELISAAHSCPDIINKSVVPTIVSGGLTMTATFTSQVPGLSTSQAAQFCGVTKFDWIQKITNLPDPSPYYAVNLSDPTNLNADIHLTSASVPFNDPYKGGYRYNPSWNSFPFYFDQNTTNQPWSLSNWDNGITLSIQDTPQNPCLAGGNSIGVRGCNGSNAPVGNGLGFTTTLAGILPDGSPLDLGVGFSWTDNFNGATGGISTTAYLGTADPRGGTGGITITAVQNTTNYQYNGVVLTTINGQPVAGPPPDTIPPIIMASANPPVLWPPNGVLTAVMVSGSIKDNEQNGTGVSPNTATYDVKDSYGLVQPSGKIVVSSDGSYAFTIELPASRNGSDKIGRKFIVTVSAQDNAGNKGSTSVGVTVPHDQRK